MGMKLRFVGAPYVRESQTSQKAAISIVENVGNLRDRVFRLLELKGSLTDQEIQEWLGMDPSTQRPRRIELVAQRKVRDSGKRKRTRSGRWATLWEAVL